MPPTLPAIIALARAGAVERGWELFEAGDHAARLDDPAALAVKGRLLKARARLVAGQARQALMAQAAAAYGAAHRLAPAPYLAINAATLQLLAGEPDQAAEGARTVLSLLDASDGPVDTPYFLAATRAEAMLLLGQRDAAEQALAEAVLRDPDGWDDRAATLAQLREIAAAQGAAAAWLDFYAPPTSLHFAGHMGIAAGGPAEARLTKELSDLLAELRPGFAWGALAAGADLIIAEGLLAAGCEVHAVLPCPAAEFEAQSVAPAGAEWAARFRAVLPRCASLRVACPYSTTVHDPLATAHAGELAIGGTVLNAARLSAKAAQLIVTDQDGGGRNTARQAALWRESLGKQMRLTIPRDAVVESLFPPEQDQPSRRLVLVAAIAVDELASDPPPSPPEIAAMVAPVAQALDLLPPGSVRPDVGQWNLVSGDIELGLAALTAIGDACRIAGTPPPAIGAHLAISTVLPDPATGTLIAYGLAAQTARNLMLQAPAGVVLVSDPLAVSLAARSIGTFATELYLPDETELGGSAHLLRKVQ